MDIATLIGVLGAFVIILGSIFSILGGLWEKPLDFSQLYWFGHYQGEPILDAGTGMVTGIGKPQEVKPGSAIYIPAGTVHGFQHTGEAASEALQCPTLILNGRYDSYCPPETCSQTMLDLLGTPAEDKRLILYETDHIPPRTEYIKETLAWLDHYLGPVR